MNKHIRQAVHTAVGYKVSDEFIENTIKTHENIETSSIKTWLRDTPDHEALKIVLASRQPYKIALPIENIEIFVSDRCGSVTSNLEDQKPEGESQKFDEYIVDSFYNGQKDALYSMLLAHTLAGIDVESENYLKGVQAVITSMENNA